MGVELRRLDPDRDEPLVREAAGWVDSQPPWFREFEEKFGTPTPEALAADMGRANQADFGVFDCGRMVGFITLVLHGKGIYEAHFRTARRADPSLMATAARSMRDQLFGALGALEIFGFIPAFNRGAIRLAEGAGLYRDGNVETHGSIRGRRVRWVRLSVSRGQWEAEHYGEKETDADAEPELQQHVELRVADRAGHGGRSSPA